MNALITGVTGFVGDHLARRLLDEGETLVGIVRDLTKAFDILDRRVIVAFGDVRDYKVLERILSEYEIDVVYHLAAQSIVRHAETSPLSTFEANVAGTWNVLEAARRCDVHALLYASTDKVYGSQDPRALPYHEDWPLNASGVYETSKACGDLLTRAYAHHYGLPAVISRACNIYGPGDLNPRIIPNTIRQCLRGEQPIIYKGMDYKREYIYIDDVIEAYVQLVENIDITKGRAFNVGSGCLATQEEIVSLILQHFPKLKPRYVDPKRYMHKEIRDQYLSSVKIRDTLNWEAKIDLHEGIRRTVEWFRSLR